MSDNRKQVGFKADKETVQQVKRKLDHGELSEELRARLEEIAYGADTTERERQREKLTELREDKREIEERIETLRHKRNETSRKIERVEERLDTLMDQEGEYDGMLQAIESQLHDGTRVLVDSSIVTDAAKAGDTTPMGVIKDLKERNPDVPDSAFRAAKADEPGKWKQEHGLRTQN